MDRAVSAMGFPPVETPDPDAGETASRKRGWLARLFDPLRTRLALLLTLTLLPPAIGGAVFAMRAHDQQMAQAGELVNQFAQLAASHERDFFENTWRLLTGLARNLGPVEPGTSCPRSFTTFLDIYPEYGTLTLVDSSGAVVCAVAPKSDGQVVASADAEQAPLVISAPWYRRMLLLRDFTIGDYSPAVHGGPEMVAAMPILNDGGKVAGAVALTLKLGRLADFLQAAGMPADGVLYALDRHGKVLFSRGAAGGPGGLPSDITVQRVVGDELLEFREPDRSGSIRAYSVVVLQGGALHVLFGLPVADTFGWINQDLSSRIIWLFGTCLAAILASYLAAYLLVTRWLLRLRGSVADYAAGRLDSRPQLDSAPFEFRDLGASFATMARRVARREAQLHQIIHEKDLLIREIHHRVKNNMQTVLSLNTLLLARQRDPRAARALAALQIRVKALALVQRHLYLDNATALIDTGELIAELVPALIDGRHGGGVVPVFTIDWPSLPLSQDQAVPLALIITELVSNALEHAFPQGTGTLTLKARTDGDQSIIVVADDGVGFESDRTPGLGLTLLPGFVKQLGASYTLDTDTGQGGTTVTLVMPVPPRRPTIRSS